MSRYRVELGAGPSEQGRSVLEVLAEAGYDLQASCGGAGRCGSCRIRVAEGVLAPPTPAEEAFLGPELLGQGWRLACQAGIAGRAVVTWEGSPPVPAGKGFADSSRALPLAPRVRRQAVLAVPPGGKGAPGDWERLNEALNLAGRPDLWSCLGLSGLERGGPSEVLVGGGALLGRAPAGRLLGAVFDLGTTTVVGGLVDLESGVLLAARAAFNAQRIYGADVLARLGRAMEGPAGRNAIRDRIRAQVRAMLQGLLADTGALPENLVDLVAVGNTAMEHLFFGFDVAGLAALPFVPVHQAGLEVPAAALDLPAHPGARLYFPPNLAGFIGADTVAGIVALDLPSRPGVTLLMDLGTNGEIVLAREGRMWACSTAAGPALEAAGIACGMPALAGAVTRAFWRGDLVFETVAGAPPRGLCGPGLLSTLALMLKYGAVDATGRIVPRGDLPAALAARIRPGDQGLEILLASSGGHEIILTQGDVRRLQLAKGAIAAGIRLLCKAAGIEPRQLDRVFLAGTFGQHLQADDAATVGLLPGIPAGRVSAAGNTAGEGARLMLANAACRAEAEALAGRIEVIELASDPDFQTVFAEEMLFPE